jgi:hypothetical protein
LAAVKRTTVQVTWLPLYLELPKVGHDLLFSAWTDRGPEYIVYIHRFYLLIVIVHVYISSVDDRLYTD